MPHFRYRAANADGLIVTGQLQALHKIDLESQLDNLGLILVRAKMLKGKVRTIKKLPLRDAISFLFQLEMLIRAGVPILSALQDLRDAAESSESKALAGGMAEKIEGGTTLAEALADYPEVFSEVVINLIRAGEASGQLPDVLQEVVKSLKWQDEIVAQSKKLMMYPAFVGTAIAGVVFFLMIFLVPQLVGFLKNMGQELPIHTKILIAVSDIFVKYWWLLLMMPPAVVSGIVALMKTDPTFRYKMHALQLKIPVVGLVIKKIALSRLADTFALMYRTGIPILDGLAYCQNISSNLAIKEAIVRTRERISVGTPISEAFAQEDLFPPLVIRMLKVGESTGALDTALNNISYFYSRDINESIDKVQAMIEPIMTVTMGLILGWIMAAVLGPIYDTISKIKI